MRKSRFSEEQMVRILRETDIKPVAEVAKKHGISEQTIYVWRRRFGTMTGDEARRLRALEHENTKLKRMLADRLLEIDVLKEINSKDSMKWPDVACASEASTWTTLRSISVPRSPRSACDARMGQL